MIPLDCEMARCIVQTSISSIHQPSIMPIVSNSFFLIHYYYFSFYYTVKVCGKWKFYEVLRELLS